MRRVLDLANLALMTSRGAKLQPKLLGLQERQPGLNFLGFSRGFSVPSGTNRAGSKREGSSSNRGSNMPPTRGGDSKSKSGGIGIAIGSKGKGSSKGKTNKREHQSQLQQPSSSSSKSNVRKTKSNIKKADTKVTTNSVEHDKEKNRFTMDLGNKQVARIDYKSIGQNLVEMYHSEVPQELRGRGIGKALAKGAFEQALKNNMRVKLTCSYLINYLEKFADPKYKSIVDNSNNK